jgi:bisphosphoglycerate-independent phosphoglycerate mutase (AlkP superfamily)
MTLSRIPLHLIFVTISQMSVHAVADKTVETIESGKYPFIVLNLANPDMVFPWKFRLRIGWTHRCL